MSYKSVVVSSIGGAEVLKVVEGDKPAPGQGEVGVRVNVAGVAFGDIMRREGKVPGSPKPPFVPGYDMTGRVEKIGEDVSGFEVGQLVSAHIGTGGYSQYVCVDANMAVRLPDSLDLFQAACLPLNYLSAYQMLHNVAKVPRGGSILIHGAGGGVGTALLQLGGLHDLKMFATASAAKQDIVKEYGGEHIDYRKQDFVALIKEVKPDLLDAVFDPISAYNWKRSYKVIRRGGTLVVFGLLGPTKGRLGSLGFASQFASLGLLIARPSKRVKFYGINVSKDPQTYRDNMGELIKLLEAEKIKPLVGKVFSLDQAAEAQRLLYDAKVGGKILLDCS